MMSALFKGRKKDRTELFYTLDAIAEYPALWKAVGDVLHGREFAVAVTIPECFEDCSPAISSIEELGLPVSWQYVKKSKSKHADVMVTIGTEDDV